MAYVINNPVAYIDPSGHIPWFIPGWSDQIAKDVGIQTGNMCAATAITAGLNVLGVNVTKHEMYTWAHVFAPQTSLDFGIPPLHQALIVNISGTASADFSKGSDRTDLLANMQNGLPTVVSVAFTDDSVGHALLAVGYDPDTGEFLFYNPAEGKVITESDFKLSYGVDFNQAWLNQPNFWIPAGSMVTLKGNGKQPPPNTTPAPSIPTPSGGGGGGRPPGNGSTINMI